MTFVNQTTSSLKPYPMEELTRIRQGLIKAGKTVYDFGTGDPKIPTWAPIRQALIDAIPQISQYPSVKGTQELNDAQCGYLKRRFGLAPSPSWMAIPSQGSKEAIFHIALSLVGRAGGKKRIIYPDPGYPVYRSSTEFAQGIPTPITIDGSTGYRLEPWTLSKDVQQSAAAIWVNHPHNPTGALADRAYWERLVAWCHETDTVLLSDDCYVDIYHSEIDVRMAAGGRDERPICPLALSTDRVVSFMSLSKRSGITGYRAGMIVGDSRIVKPVLTARANFGVGSPEFVQKAASIAWSDDVHVAERRKIFTQRINTAVPVFKALGLLDLVPEATFYLWTKVPKNYPGDDVAYCLEMAELGIITSPSQWLSEGMKGFARFALVPDESDTAKALGLFQQWVTKYL